MNISEILRALLDKLDAIENGVDSMDTDTSSEPKMMPPLTQRTELLKKAVGVDSEFDDETDCGCGGNDIGSDLMDIKKRAGIISLSDDEPFNS